ncbi:MAG: AMP-binding protein [Acidimicrobiales bacterium]
MGWATPGYEAVVVDPETGELCEPGHTGELWMRGTRGIQLFLEYLDNPEANAKAFTDDGWFRTGDMVQVDEAGRFFYQERDKDLLKVGRRTSRPVRSRTPAGRWVGSPTSPWWAGATRCSTRCRWRS